MWDVGRSASTDVLSGTSSLVGAPDEVFGTHRMLRPSPSCPLEVEGNIGYTSRSTSDAVSVSGSVARCGDRISRMGRTYSTDNSWLSKALRLLIAERRCSVKDAGVKRIAPVRKSVTGKFLDRKSTR